MIAERCCAGLAEDHDGRPGQCYRALMALCARVDERTAIAHAVSQDELDRRQRDREDMT